MSSAWPIKAILLLSITAIPQKGKLIGHGEAALNTDQWTNDKDICFLNPAQRVATMIWDTYDRSIVLTGSNKSYEGV